MLASSRTRCGWLIVCALPFLAACSSSSASAGTGAGAGGTTGGASGTSSGGASGGSEPGTCMTTDDCQSTTLCMQCTDGSTSCYDSVCIAGRCMGSYSPPCPGTAGAGGTGSGGTSGASGAGGGGGSAGAGGAAKACGDLMTSAGPACSAAMACPSGTFCNYPGESSSCPGGCIGATMNCTLDSDCLDATFVCEEHPDHCCLDGTLSSNCVKKCTDTSCATGTHCGSSGRCECATDTCPGNQDCVAAASGNLRCIRRACTKDPDCDCGICNQGFCSSSPDEGVCL